jgi:hypothetical protein
VVGADTDDQISLTAIDGEEYFADIIDRMLPISVDSDKRVVATSQRVIYGNVRRYTKAEIIRRSK